MGARPISAKALLLGLLATLVALVALDLAWSATALGIELALGDRLLAHHPSETDKNAADAVWHVATAFVIALPTRRLAAWVATPALALAFDVDHVFGGLLPTVVIRSAHDVFFVAILALAMTALRGPTGALLSVGAVVEHLAVDGGGFPLFAPLSTATYVFPFALQAGLIGIGAILVFLAVRPPRELGYPQGLVPVVAAAGGLAAGMYLLWPTISPYTHT